MPKKPAKAAKPVPVRKKVAVKRKAAPPAILRPAPQAAAVVLDRLWAVIMERRSADPTISHSAGCCPAACPRWRRNSARKRSNA